MDFPVLKQKDKQFIANTYARFEIDIEKGKGVYAENADGVEFIDFSSGIGVNALGFANPNWVQAVCQQAGKLAHVSNLYYTAPQVQLAQTLCQLTGFEKVFFSNSGAEANECAIKAARKYGADKYGADRCEIITLHNSFHGRTIATLAATGQDVFHEDFGPFPAGFVHAQPNDIKDLHSKVTNKTTAIFIELVQGEGGVVPLSEEFVSNIAKICEEKDILLMLDEVQTGAGRTGSFLCAQQYGIKPDLVTMAKGLGGGLPIGATLFGAKTKEVLGFGKHGTTFGGNPIVAAGAIEVLKYLTPEVLQSVKEKGEYIAEKVSMFKQVIQVTGKGLMLGIELANGIDNREVANEMARRGVMVLTAKNKLRLLPPLTITKQEIDMGLKILQEVLQKEGEN